MRSTRREFFLVTVNSKSVFSWFKRSFGDFAFKLQAFLRKLDLWSMHSGDWQIKNEEMLQSETSEKICAGKKFQKDTFVKKALSQQRQILSVILK